MNEPVHLTGRSIRQQAPALPADASVQGLYLHIPFCAAKCHYCDFYSIVEGANERHSPLVRAMLAELDSLAAGLDRPPRPEAIFVGGGTPSALSLEAWRILLDGLGRRGVLEAVKEFTSEANPESVTAAWLEELRERGVNRISLGAQSFDPAMLEMLQRWHTPGNVDRAVGLIRDAGIDNLNIDLIFAIPGQTLARLEADIDHLLSLAPQHVSYYNLTYEPDTAMTARLKRNAFTPVDEETERRMYAHIIARLDDAGFEHYEISNWAAQPSGGRDTLRCRHNLLYWQSRNWLGIGPGAASHIDGIRWRNEPAIDRYLEATPHPPVIDVEQLPRDEQAGERLMMHLRLREGVPLTWIDGCLPAEDPRRAAIAELQSMGMLEQTSTHLRLSEDGLMVADAVLAKLI